MSGRKSYLMADPVALENVGGSDRGSEHQEVVKKDELAGIE